MNVDTAYSNVSVLVTGASGFIGSQLSRRLVQLGARVTGTYFNNPRKGGGVQWLYLDLTDSEALRSAIDSIQPRYIFHLAGEVQGRREPDAVRPTLEGNLSAAVSLLLAAQDVGCCHRIVFANSQEEPEPGEQPPVPASPYAAAKFASSAYARMFHSLYGLPVVLARIFMVYGPEQGDRDKLIPYTIEQALQGKPPQLSSGKRAIDWIYVDDVVEGLLRMGSQSGIDGQTIDLGSGTSRTIKATVEEILQQTGSGLQADFGALPDRLMEREPVADIESSSAKLGWRPQVSLGEGLARTIAWYRSQMLSRD